MKINTPVTKTSAEKLDFIEDYLRKYFDGFHLGFIFVMLNSKGCKI